MFRSGGTISDEDPRVLLAEELESLHVVSLVRISTVKCRLEGDSDFDDALDGRESCAGQIEIRNGSVDGICPECGRRVWFEGKREFRSLRTNLDWSGIVDYVKHGLTGYEIRSPTAGLIEVKLDQLVVRICLPEICERDLYIEWFEQFPDPIVYIISNSGRIHASDYPPDVSVLTLATMFLSENLEETLLRILHEAARADESQLDHAGFDKFQDDLTHRFQKMSSSDFEVFIGNLLSAAQKQPSILESYSSKLRKRSGSLLGALVRVIGGTGAEDIMVEPKVEYLHNFFQGSGTYEMKLYNSAIGLAELRELIEHCEQRNTPGIMFTSSSVVSGSVWSRIRTMKESQGRWKYIVIDKDLLAEILIELRLQSLLSP